MAVYDTVQRSLLGKCYLTSRGFTLTHAIQVTVASALVVKYGGLAEAEPVYNLVITKYDGHSEAEATAFIGTKYDGHSEVEVIYNFAGTKYDGLSVVEVIYNFAGTKYDGHYESTVSV